MVFFKSLQSLVKLVESNCKIGFQIRYESCLEVDGVVYMLGVGYLW